MTKQEFIDEFIRLGKEMLSVNPDTMDKIQLAQLIQLKDQDEIPYNTDTDSND